MILTQCAACAKPLAHDAPRCIRCWTRYCDASCQLEHWNNGHKKQCKKIARGGGAEQFHADAKAKEAADAAVADCAPRIPADAICYICRNDASAQGLVTGCGCHGGDGIAHVTCLVRMARSGTADGEETGIASWQRCCLCHQLYHGSTKRALGWTCWQTYLSLSETDELRSTAMGILANALRYFDDATALQVAEANIALIRRYYPNSPNLLAAQSAAATCYDNLGRPDEALRLYRELYAARMKRHGAADENTIRVGNCLSSQLRICGRFAEAKPFARSILKQARQFLGHNNEELAMAAARLGEILMSDLSQLGAEVAEQLAANFGHDFDNICHFIEVAKLRRADVVEAEALFAEVVKVRRVILGPEHPFTANAVWWLENARRALSEA